MSQVPVFDAQKCAINASTFKKFAATGSVIPPGWPLHRWIAVNPWWGVRQLPSERASQIPGSSRDTSMFMPMSFYRDAWHGGRIQEEDLTAAVAESASSLEISVLLDALGREESTTVNPAPLMLEEFTEPGQPSSLSAIREQVARACGLFFDKAQSRWLSTASPGSLFQSWLEQTINDVALEHRTGLKGARSLLKSVSGNQSQCIEWTVKTLGLSEADLEQLGHRLLFELAGWGSWCRGVDWRQNLEGRDSSCIEEFVGILLLWEAVAIAIASPDQRRDWKRAWSVFRNRAMASKSSEIAAQPVWVWHRAFEIGYQRQLVGVLSHASPPALPEAERPDFQAVFCIDVRSEVIRRHLEASCPGAQTIGFAGFFGMPISYQSLCAVPEIPRLPGLLAPAYRLAESTEEQHRDRQMRRSSERRAMVRQSVRKAKYSSFSSFTLVESTGLAWAWKLVRDSVNRPKPAKPSDLCSPGRLHHRHGGDPVSDVERTALAENLLRGMSLTSNFAPVLLFVGHGSHTDNNPHQASLACGACGGQNGGLNARVAAQLVNDPVIRAGLAKRGIRIPDFTLAIAAEHCTVTDTLTIMDKAAIPDSHHERLRQLETAFEEAGRRTRRERATSLGLNGLEDVELLAAMKQRSTDWSEVRPEWGLANNASLIFAKRRVSRGLNLAGRAFLHDYDPDLDADGGILEGLMTAPMIVANWINLQYLGSVSAPATFGAGNKLLHSVVGGNLGVVEGNDPDLRIGLSRQSVHDGQRWRHEPVRLSVVIDAPRARIEQILARQPDVARLVENRWLWLFRLSGEGVEVYRDGSWVAW